MPTDIEVVVKSIINEASGINVWEFRCTRGHELPPFTAGAHIDLHLPSGLVRSYSLCNSQEERNRYAVAVSNSSASRGGSQFIHEKLRAGDTILISAPRNNFPLIEDTEHTVFIAGGIGVTPIWSMIQRLEFLGRTWELHYCARNPQACAFKEHFEVLERKAGGRVHFHLDEGRAGTFLDLSALVRRSRSGAHLYCCGPEGMISAFEAAANENHRPQSNIHVEYFSGKQINPVEGGFKVVLQRSGRELKIPAGKTILDILLDNGVDVPFSCMQGVCGACEVRLIEGVPDHCDVLMSPEQRLSEKTIILCCSGSKSDRLVLDL